MKRKLTALASLVLCIIIAGCSGEASFNARISNMEKDIKNLKGEIAILKGTESESIVESEAGIKGESQAETTTKEEKILTVNDEAMFLNWTYKIQNICFVPSVGEYKAKGIYAIVVANFTNNSTTSNKLGSSFVMRDDAGRIFDMSTDVSLEYHQKHKTEAWYLDEIGPSFSAVIPVAFDVAIDSKELLLYSEDDDTDVVLIADEITKE